MLVDIRAQDVIIRIAAFACCVACLHFNMVGTPLHRRVVDFKVNRMAKGKSKTILCKLVSAAQTGFFYVTSKNPRRLPEKLVLRK